VTSSDMQDSSKRLFLRRLRQIGDARVTRDERREDVNFVAWASSLSRVGANCRVMRERTYRQANEAGGSGDDDPVRGRGIISDAQVGMTKN